MTITELIARINELSKKSRETGLSDSERAEQAELRSRYIDHIKVQVKAQLECIEIVDDEKDCKCGSHTPH